MIIINVKTRMFGIKRGVWLSQNDPEKSDDSEDSDFEPTTKELDEVNLPKERSKSTTPKRPRKRARQEDTSNSNSAPGEEKDWGTLPITVLDKIFEHLVQKEEDYRVVVRNAAVNYHWWSAASRPSLRKKLKLFMNTKVIFHLANLYLKTRSGKNAKPFSKFPRAHHQTSRGRISALGPASIRKFSKSFDEDSCSLGRI